MPRATEWGLAGVGSGHTKFGEVHGWSLGGASLELESLLRVAREKWGWGRLLACPFPHAEVAVDPGSAMPGVHGFSGKPFTLSTGTGGILWRAVIAIVKATPG